MSITIRKALKTLLGQFTHDSAVKEISSRALDHFQQKLEEIAKSIAKEAVKNCNYSRLSPMDIGRGFQKWHESQIVGKLKIAIESD
jgi:hypothetical protein